MYVCNVRIFILHYGHTTDQSGLYKLILRINGVFLLPSPTVVCIMSIRGVLILPEHHVYVFSLYIWGCTTPYITYSNTGTTKIHECVYSENTCGFDTSKTPRMCIFFVYMGLCYYQAPCICPF